MVGKLNSQTVDEERREAFVLGVDRRYARVDPTVERGEQWCDALLDEPDSRRCRRVDERLLRRESRAYLNELMASTRLACSRLSAFSICWHKRVSAKACERDDSGQEWQFERYLSRTPLGIGPCGN